MRRPRRNHTAAFKAKVAITALKGDETLAALLLRPDEVLSGLLCLLSPEHPINFILHRAGAIAEKFDVHPSQITQWKTQLLENASGVFATSSSSTKLRNKIGPYCCSSC